MPQSTDNPLASSAGSTAPFNLTVQLTVEDYRRYFALVGKRQSNWITLTVLVAVLFAAILVALLFRTSASWETTDPAAIELVGRYSLLAYATGVGAILVLGSLLRRRGIMTTLASTPHAFDPKTILMDENTVAITGTLSEVRYAWPAFTQVTAARELLCLWIGPQSAVIIPYRAFASNEALRAAIAFIEQKIAAVKSPRGAQ